MLISIRFVTDLPFILVFQANQNQINESSIFGLTCMVKSSTSTNMSKQNKETDEVIRTGISTDTLSFTETSAKCYQTAEQMCIATNIAGSTTSSPVKILVNFSIVFHLVLFKNLQTNFKSILLKREKISKVHVYIITAQSVAINMYVNDDMYVYSK